MNINMKKQINTVSNWSVKGIIAVTILSSMLFNFEAKGGNKSSLAKNEDAQLMQSGNIIETWMNSDTYWGAPSEIKEVEPMNLISQWMVSNSYWGIDTQIWTETENLSVIEPWMNSNRYWGMHKTKKHVRKTLPIEWWMSSTSYWINGNTTGNQVVGGSVNVL